MVCLVAGHFFYVMTFFEPAISSIDANGYYAQARLIAEDGRAGFAPDSPFRYIGQHWLEVDDGWRVSRYPPGLSLLLAIPFKLGGPTMTLLVNPLLASLTLAGLYLLCAGWLGRGWGLVAALVMAVNPVANSRILSYDSHTAVTFFLLWGLYFLARWSRTKSMSVGFLAGLFLGTIPSIRYAESLFALAIALFVLSYTNRKQQRDIRSVVVMLSGVAIPVIALLIRNHLVFGAFWRTAYNISGEVSDFGVDSFAQHAVPYLRTIFSHGLGVFAGLGIVGISLACCRKDSWREGLLLAGIVVPSTLLYMAYDWYSGRPESTLRFLLPTFYLYTIGGAWCFKLLNEARSNRGWVAATIALTVTTIWGVNGSNAELSRLEYDNGRAATIWRAAESHVPEGSFIVADKRVHRQLDFVGKWRLVDSALIAAAAAPAVRGFAAEEKGRFFSVTYRRKLRKLLSLRYECSVLENIALPEHTAPIKPNTGRHASGPQSATKRRHRRGSLVIAGCSLR